MIERRKYPRFELKIDAKYRILNPEEIFKYCKTRNISAEGVCFESDVNLSIGAYVDLEVDLEDNMPPVSLVGEIRWSSELKARRSEKKRYLNGVKLINISKTDESRFLKYYCDKMVEKLSGYLKI